MLGRGGTESSHKHLFQMRRFRFLCCFLNFPLRALAARVSAPGEQIPVGMYGGLPFNLLLNNVPHSKMARNFIYKGAAEALVTAVQDPSVPRRMKVRRLRVMWLSLGSLSWLHIPMTATKKRRETHKKKIMYEVRIGLP